MSMFPVARECSCGSGEYREAIHDARGIFVTYCCSHCKRERLRGFRPEIFDDPLYDCDEPVEPEEGAYNDADLY